MALSASTRDTNIIPRALARGLIRDVIWKEPYHIMFIICLNMRKSCSVLWTFSQVINIILRGMIKGRWYRYQSRQTNTDVMFFQYIICKFPLFSSKYMIYIVYVMVFNGNINNISVLSWWSVLLVEVEYLKILRGTCDFRFLETTNSHYQLLHNQLFHVVLLISMVNWS